MVIRYRGCRVAGGDPPVAVSLVTACIGRTEINRQFIEVTVGSASADLAEVVFVSNGSTSEEEAELEGLLGATGRPYKALRYPEPLGTSGAFNEGVRAASGDVMAVFQNDLLVSHPGWDQEIALFFGSTPHAGVLGFAGARRFGSADLYQTPYDYRQLGRSDVFSSLEDWHFHGHRCDVATRVAVLDGLAMCFTRADWERWGGFDERYQHHCYDIDFSLTAHLNGKANFVYPIRCRHLNGQTVNFAPAYAAQVAHRGGDLGIHQESHQMLYEKFRGRIPVEVA